MESVNMTKKERFNAVCQMQLPDYMPVWPRAMSQLIHGMGWRLSDVTGATWYDSDRCTEAVLWSLENIGYDVALPAYTDIAFGVLASGGSVVVPTTFGASVGIDDRKPVQSKDDWPKVQRKLARKNAVKRDPRMQGALETSRNVAAAVGDSTPLVASGYLSATMAMLLFRPMEAFLLDMVYDPHWADEMCRLAHEFTKDWIRAQYAAGANSVTFVVDTLGIFLIEPKLAERFSLPYLVKLVEMVKKEYNQGVWLHIHGNMKTSMGYAYLEKIVRESGIEGLHLNEIHSVKWIKEMVVNKFNIPACAVVDCNTLANSSINKIWAMVKNMIPETEDGPGFIMAPCCQVLPHTSNENFKAWVGATHQYGAYG